MFENGVELGSPTVMINSGHINGVPGHANYHLLTEVLKQEMKFEGFTVSDWEDIKVSFKINLVKRLRCFKSAIYNKINRGFQTT